MRRRVHRLARRRHASLDLLRDLLLREGHRRFSVRRAGRVHERRRGLRAGGLLDDDAFFDDEASLYDGGDDAYGATAQSVLVEVNGRVVGTAPVRSAIAPCVQLAWQCTVWKP